MLLPRPVNRFQVAIISHKNTLNTTKRKREIKPNRLISLYFSLGDPYGTRTRVTGVRGQRPRPLDEGAMLCAIF